MFTELFTFFTVLTLVGSQQQAYQVRNGLFSSALTTSQGSKLTRKRHDKLTNRLKHFFLTNSASKETKTIFLCRFVEEQKSTQPLASTALYEPIYEFHNCGNSENVDQMWLELC